MIHFMILIPDSFYQSKNNAPLFGNAETMSSFATHNRSVVVASQDAVLFTARPLVPLV